MKPTSVWACIGKHGRILVCSCMWKPEEDTECLYHLLPYSHETELHAEHEVHCFT